MLLDLTLEQKKEIRCEVDIYLEYENCEEVRCRFETLNNLLLNEGVAANIFPTRGTWGPAVVFRCKGTFSLASAEKVLSCGDQYYLPIEISYDNGSFILRKKIR